MFHPHGNKYPYPEYTDQHYLGVKEIKDIIFDDKYPYIDTSGSFKFKKWLVRVLLYLIVFPFSRVKIGLKIRGRKILKTYKKDLKNGAITVSNHIHMWDYIAIMKAIWPVKPHVLVWAPNVRGESGSLVRLVGGIPIPDENKAGSIAFNKAVDKYLKDGNWLQVYAEGSMWEYYPYIRPFKTGAASLACRYDKPILPIGFSFRKPSWIRKHIFKQDAAITLSIGKPIFKDNTLSEGKQRDDLTIRAHDAICLLADLKPEENLYSPLFNHSKRVDE